MNAWRQAHLAPTIVSAPESLQEEEPLPARVQVDNSMIPPIPAVAPANDLPPQVAPDAENPPAHPPPQVVPDAEIPPAHSMTTRVRAGIVKPNPRYALFTVKDEVTEPKSLKAALQHPGWTKAMGVEVDNMSETGTFELVPPEENRTPLSCGWVHKVKRNADGTVF